MRQASTYLLSDRGALVQRQKWPGWQKLSQWCSMFTIVHCLMKFGNASDFCPPIRDQHWFAGAGRLADHVDRVRCYDHGVSYRQNTGVGVWLFIGGDHATIRWQYGLQIFKHSIWTALRGHQEQIGIIGGGKCGKLLRHMRCHFVGNFIAAVVAANHYRHAW